MARIDAQAMPTPISAISRCADRGRRRSSHSPPRRTSRPTMCVPALPMRLASQGRRVKRGDCGDAVVDREQQRRPSCRPPGRRRLRGSAEPKKYLGDDRRRVDPHDEQRRPAEELDQRQPLHDRPACRRNRRRCSRACWSSLPRRASEMAMMLASAVGDQQAAEQVHLLFERELLDDDQQDRSARGDPEQGSPEASRRQRADRRRRPVRMIGGLAERPPSPRANIPWS